MKVQCVLFFTNLSTIIKIKILLVERVAENDSLREGRVVISHKNVNTAVGYVEKKKNNNTNSCADYCVIIIHSTLTLVEKNNKDDYGLWQLLLLGGYGGGYYGRNAYYGNEYAAGYAAQNAYAVDACSQEWNHKLDMCFKS